MAAPLRTITLDDLRGPLELVAELEVADEELDRADVELSERAWSDGLGEYSGCYVELATGEQFLLRRFDGRRELDVLGLIERDAREQVARLAAALELSERQITWETPPDAWHELQAMLKRYRSETE
jgi:hypothetical protein